MWVEGRGHLPGRLVVVSGPSGSGKSTVLQRALARAEFRDRLQLSVSATTREPRPGEQHGHEYYFYPNANDFRLARDQGEFLESAEYNGNLYGTPKKAVYDALEHKKHVLLEIEVLGAKQIRELAPGALYVFVKTRRFADLEQRLRNRGTEMEPSLQRRLRIARHELDEAHCYDEVLINDDLDRCVEEFVALLKFHGCGG